MDETVTLAELRGLPLFAALDDAALRLLAEGLGARAIVAGQELVHQGRPPEGAWFLEDAEADVVTRVPGGGERLLATVGSGALIGDTVLIDAGPPTATVRASKDGRALFLGRAWFRGLLGQGNPVALAVLRAVQARLAQRLRSLGEELSAGDPVAPADATVQTVTAAAPAAPAMDVRPYLPLLPFFAGFAPGHIDAVMAAGRPMEIPPGGALYAIGDARDGIYVIVRGAIRVLACGDAARLPRAVLGPGRAVGLMALVLGTEHGNTCMTAEGATVLHVPEATCRALYQGQDRLSQAFLEAVSRDLLYILARMTNDLSRLAGQRLIRERMILQASR